MSNMDRWINISFFIMSTVFSRLAPSNLEALSLVVWSRILVFFLLMCHLFSQNILINSNGKNFWAISTDI